MTDHRGSRLGRQLLVGACVLVAVALVGAVLGPVWWLAAPDRAVGTSLGDGQVFTGTAQEVFAGEGWFALITAAAGMVTGYGAYMVQFCLSRLRIQDLRLVCLVGGFLGAAVATVLTWQIGTALDAPLHGAAAGAAHGESVTVGLQLRATAFLAAWPFLFVLQYGLLDAISMARGDLPGVPQPAPALRSEAEVAGVRVTDGSESTFTAPPSADGVSGGVPVTGHAPAAHDTPVTTEPLATADSAVTGHVPATAETPGNGGAPAVEPGERPAT
ncbi:hypothetical protein [Nocardiopsis sp. CNR-923]|uniref:hypothetical protein n=1 Tax=Nocardiopsis sp. CNR-923 TaxID=1904965 RepID=UPI00165150DA|nr:hypothetical protein [Nocardiopsis sp. CNR-923]